MKIFLVTVRPPPALASRYFDSIWVAKSNAEERTRQLRDELKRSGHKTWFTGNILDNEWHVTITEANVMDGRIADEVRQNES